MHYVFAGSNPAGFRVFEGGSESVPEWSKGLVLRINSFLSWGWVSAQVQVCTVREVQSEISVFSFDYSTEVCRFVLERSGNFGLAYFRLTASTTCTHPTKALSEVRHLRRMYCTDSVAVKCRQLSVCSDRALLVSHFIVSAGNSTQIKYTLTWTLTLPPKHVHARVRMT